MQYALKWLLFCFFSARFLNARALRRPPFGDRPSAIATEPEVAIKTRPEEIARESPPPPPPSLTKASTAPAPIALGAPEASVPVEMPKELPTARGPVAALEGVGDPNGVS